jgi:hypothetical protein
MSAASGASPSATKSRVDAIVVTTDSLFNANGRAMADLAAKKRLPAAGTKDFRGSWRLDWLQHELFRRI